MPDDGKERAPAVVLLSGGMDSCVVAAIAAQTHPLALLHAGYGQRTEHRELQAFRDIARHYGAARTLESRIPHLGTIGGSSLTDSRRDAIEPRRDQAGIPDTYVPFRNTHLLALAVSWAEVLEATDVYIGAVAEDGSGYPDCTVAYYEAFRKLVTAGTRPGSGLTILTPLIGMRKHQIVAEGLRLNAPLHLTWSCYVDSDRACGRCESCRLRMKGFRDAGVPDPIVYR